METAKEIIRKKEWFPIPPYRNESWRIVNRNGELVATFEDGNECIMASALFNINNYKESHNE